MDDTYVRVKGTWEDLYRAVDRGGATVGFLLTAKRDRKAALRFLRKAIRWKGRVRRSRSTRAAPTGRRSKANAEHERGIEMRQVKYLNNIVEQHHGAIKRLVRPMLGFKSFGSAAMTVARIELMHMIGKGQLQTIGDVRPAQQFYSLSGYLQP
jgi:putative transposase